MDNGSSNSLRALRLLFRPVARMLLRAGVNWKEVAETCKATYVEVATEDFGIRGRPTNVSRVAILTGLTRREVRRLKDLLADESTATFERMNQATRVLTGWYTDEAFSDSGEPRPLSVTGDDGSFEVLCRRYCGDVPYTTVLKELKHAGAMEEVEGGRVVAKTRYFMPAMADPEQILRSGSVLEDIGDTVAYNLHRDSMEPSRFERRASNNWIPKTATAEFRAYVEKEGQAFLEKVDGWLSERENTEETNCVRLGLGTYWIESDETERN